MDPRQIMKNDSTPFDWITLVLLVLIILVATWGLVATDWADHLSLVPVLGVAGVLAGTALARSRFSQVRSTLFGIVYGIFMVGWQTGKTLDPSLIWRDKILALLERLGTYAAVLIQGETNKDPLMFVGVMSIVFWIIGISSAWILFRRGGVWGVVLPGGLVVLLIANFYLGETNIPSYLAVYLLIALILTARIDLVRREQAWKREKARVPPETMYQVGRTGIVTSLLLVGLSWGVPALARSEAMAKLWRALSKPLYSTGERIGDALGGIRGPIPVIQDFYGETLRLEGGAETQELFVMEIQPNRLPSGRSRFYWRSRVYGEYVDGAWNASEGEIVEFNPGEVAPIDYSSNAREIIEVKIIPKASAQVMLYVPAQPLWVERSAELIVIRDGDEIVDISRVQPHQIVRREETVRAVSSIAIPSSVQLRLAGENYPDWIDRYLQLPDSITPRTLNLAQDIAIGLETPYDKVVAVTSWLRGNIEYSRVGEAPPSDSEPIDWFLFDYKIGFCNYYASAEVILLRSLGIPARLAAGYARGTYDSAREVYEVYGEDSHSWPEVFFPGIGWVEFEPTVSQPPLIRPEPLDLESESGDLAGQDDSSLDGFSPEEFLDDLLLSEEDVGPSFFSRLSASPLFLWILGVLLILGALGLWILMDPYIGTMTRSAVGRGLTRLGFETPANMLVQGQQWLTSTGIVYARWSAWLARLDLPHSAAHTAYERAVAFESAMPKIAEPAWKIVEDYSRERFGGESVDEAGVRKAWKEMRVHLWRNWIGRLTRQLRRPEDREDRFKVGLHRRFRS